MRQDTLVFLLKDDTQEILLAMKKRGFGAGKFNGAGGKVQQGESIEAAAVRETEEEVCVKVAEQDLVKVAEHMFHFQDKPEWDIQCHVFFTRAWAGEPAESEEMAPEWFDRSQLPFDRMWVDDKYWLPMVLRGDYVKGTFHFSNDGSVLLQYTLEGAPRKL
jgi:ADP-ribose pyrophosphatase YjhB (NUDIX family)